jgi:tetratricopeptide (TPR) repeat protein
MTNPEQPAQISSGPPAMKRWVVVLLPVLFLALAFLALLYRRGSVGHGRESRPVLSQEESRRLADLSKSTIDQGHYQDALQPTLRLYKAYPENHIYIGRLADIYAQLGQYGEEAGYWEKYMDYAPTPIEACPQFGQAYWKQGEKFETKAIAAYQRCLALDPSNTDSIFYLAHALEMSSQWPQAAEQYQKGLAISPSYTDLTLGLARCQLRMDKPDSARKLIVPVLNQHPTNSGAMLVLGMYYLHQENYAGAKKVLTSGSQLVPSDPDFPVLLARVADQMSDNAEALRQYSRIVELKPGDERARSKRDALQAMQNAAQ